MEYSQPQDGTTKTPNEIASQIFENFDSVISSIGWEAVFYLKKGGSLDRLTDDIEWLKKEENGFNLYGRDYIYVK
jgi:hypothetical protein